MLDPDEFEQRVTRRQAEKQKEKQRIKDLKDIRIALDDLLIAGEIDGDLKDCDDFEAHLESIEKIAADTFKDSKFKYQFRKAYKDSRGFNKVSISLVPNPKMHNWERPTGKHYNNFVYPYWHCMNCQVTAYTRYSNDNPDLPIASGFPEGGFDDHYRYDIDWSKSCSRGVCK